jgi:hypothetical protein
LAQCCQGRLDGIGHRRQRKWIGGRAAQPAASHARAQEPDLAHLGHADLEDPRQRLGDPLPDALAGVAGALGQRRQRLDCSQLPDRCDHHLTHVVLRMLPLRDQERHHRRPHGRNHSRQERLLFGCQELDRLHRLDEVVDGPAPLLCERFTRAALDGLVGAPEVLDRVLQEPLIAEPGEELPDEHDGEEALEEHQKEPGRPVRGVDVGNPRVFGIVEQIDEIGCRRQLQERPGKEVEIVGVLRFLGHRRRQFGEGGVVALITEDVPARAERAVQAQVQKREPGD